VHQTVVAGPGEYQAALLQTAITLLIAALCAFLYRRYRKPYLFWFALSWILYSARLLAIDAFLATRDWIWLYWHQVATGWTGLALLWAALQFSRRPRWRPAYLAAALFPVAWSYIAIYRLDNFLLAAMPAVVFLSAVTLGTGLVFAIYYRQVRSSGAALLAGALLLWGAHHLDYPFLRARGMWTPWGYYLDILFTGATAAGILVLLLDDVRRGLAALLTVSDDLAQRSRGDGLGGLLERMLALPAVRGGALYAAAGGIRLQRGAGVCSGWSAQPADSDETRLIADAVANGQPRFASRWQAEPGPVFRYAAVLPVFDGPSATHALVIVGDARDPFAALDTGYLVALGQQIGAALHRDALYARLESRTAELERLSRRMLQQHEDERRRLSLHLHDETAQLFTAVKLQLGVLLEQQRDDAQRRRLGGIVDLLDEGISSIRNVTNDLRPSLLDDLGLLPALRSLASDWAGRSGITVALHVPESLPPLAPDAELALFRALQESLSNVTQHAGAKHVDVTVAARNGGLDLSVADDGRGFPPGGAVDGLERAGHLGLAGMRERITTLGGSVALERGPRGGASVRIHVPVTS
jgi:signal transduction histidine kinase